MECCRISPIFFLSIFLNFAEFFLFFLPILGVSDFLIADFFLPMVSISNRKDPSLVSMDNVVPGSVVYTHGCGV